MSVNKKRNLDCHIKTINYLFFYLFYLYIYLPDLQETDFQNKVTVAGL